MTVTPSQAVFFRRLVGLGFLCLSILGGTSLSMKEIPLALFGQHTTGVVKKVEIIQTSTSSKWESQGLGSQKAVSRGGNSTFMHIGLTTREGQPVEIKTVATFRTEAVVGDRHPMVYLPWHPENAKIYSAKQLWLPMCAGLVFTAVCLLVGLFLVRRPSAIGAGVRH